MADSCFHCGEPCPQDSSIHVERDGALLPMCCHGCRAVSELIFSSGLNRYYEFRTSEGRKAEEDPDQVLEIWKSCDLREDLWGEKTSGGMRDLLLQTEGVECAACAWLIRSRLEPRKGVERVQVDVGTGYTRIVWNPDEIRLSDLAIELSRIGYRPHLPMAESEQRARLNERRTAMLRVGVAGLGMMQVMMYAVGLYAGEALGISAGAQRFLEWTSLLVTIPVVLFSARPFFTSALASLGAKRLNMDVPVALAISVAFIASCVNFLRGSGDVYFDSVVMFVFFLSSARYIQLAQRHRNLEAGTALARLIPDWARRTGDGGDETILVSDLKVDDRIRVRAGEVFSADGIIESGSTAVDESLLTGESRPVPREAGEAVVGGSINLSSPVLVRVSAVGNDSTVSSLGRMLVRAGIERSRFVTASERIAAYFVAAVLVIAVVTGVAWYFVRPEEILPAVLAVLVVSCPCALSLAAPAAVAAAGRSLLRSGVMMTSNVAIEALSGIDVAVFDKTGTLTQGRPEVSTVSLNPDFTSLDNNEVAAIAAALEMHSAHPIARAFRVTGELPAVSDVEAVSHGGVRGLVDGESWAIGSASFVGVAEDDSGSQDISIWLSRNGEWVARFDVRDDLRPGTEEVFQFLADNGIETIIASGDRAESVSHLARRLNGSAWFARQEPQMKIERVRALQSDGKRVLMVGDGVNDAPVLAAADVSMTVSGAADLANSAADFILTAESLSRVADTMENARATRRITRQNFTWAIAYNTLALPLAMSGLLQPWMAALGMSLSSLLVVANSARLSRYESRQEPVPTPLVGAGTA